MRSDHGMKTARRCGQHHLKAPLTFLWLGLLAAALIWVFGWATRPPEPTTPPLRLAATGDITGFARASEPREFAFPRDHGPHLDFQTEWWYYTGNLATAAGRHFGYQLTFFRRGLSPTAPERASKFGANQVYFAHFALTDVGSDSHTSFERFSRGAMALAGAAGEPFMVWIDDWRVEALDAKGDVVRLVAVTHTAVDVADDPAGQRQVEEHRPVVRRDGSRKRQTEAEAASHDRPPPGAAYDRQRADRRPGRQRRAVHRSDAVEEGPEAQLPDDDRERRGCGHGPHPPPPRPAHPAVNTCDTLHRFLGARRRASPSGWRKLVTT